MCTRLRVVALQDRFDTRRLADRLAEVKVHDRFTTEDRQFIERLDSVTARRVYPNCPRYIHKYHPVQRSSFVPRPNVATPIPAWKQAAWAADVLPANDPAKGTA